MGPNLVQPFDGLPGRLPTSPPCLGNRNDTLDPLGEHSGISHSQNRRAVKDDRSGSKTHAKYRPGGKHLPLLLSAA